MTDDEKSSGSVVGLTEEEMKAASRTVVTMNGDPGEALLMLEALGLEGFARQWRTG